MKKINLEIKQIFKTIEINGKRIRIPKMGLKHNAIVTQSESISDGYTKVIKSIHPNLSMAERDLVTLHLLQYNGKLSDKCVIDGHEYSLDDVQITQCLKFYVGDLEFRFRTPQADDMPPTVDQILQKYCVSVKNNDGVEQPIPDFLKMPAFVHEWVSRMCDSISLKTEHGDIKGLYDLMGAFDG